MGTGMERSRPSEGKLEREPAGELAHLRLRGLRRLLLGVGDGDEEQILEHLDVGRITTLESILIDRTVPWSFASTVTMPPPEVPFTLCC